jgi:hypothetical protein
VKVSDRVRVVSTRDRNNNRVGVVRHILVAVQLDGDEDVNLSWYEAADLVVVAERRRRGDGTVFESPLGSGRWWAKIPDGHGGDKRRRAKSRADAEKKLAQLHKERQEREKE